MLSSVRKLFVIVVPFVARIVVPFLLVVVLLLLQLPIACCSLPVACCLPVACW